MSTLLGIESSCDETAAAVVRDGTEVLSSVVVSQVMEHARYGGVVPEIAGRSHLRAILPTIDRALEQAGIGLDAIDALAVTRQPGLIGSLLVGLSAAKALAFARGLPLVGVDHIHAHAYSAVMEYAGDPYPSVTLVVSGGHTALYLARSALDLESLASTADDAAGEAFDKVAHLLGLPYPGGPSISELARSGNPRAIAFPRYRAKPGRPGFSFSGLKTAVLYHLRGTQPGALAPAAAEAAEMGGRADVAASFQEALVDALVEPTLRHAVEQEVEHVAVVGGVACNRRLREKLGAAAAERGLTAIFPSPAYCTDNAAMIAGLGQHLLDAGRIADLGLDASAQSA